ncbi:Predicted lipoprotein with conserved Yx(FWY)xxD motif [Nocardioides sp. YR527]|nr:Predicted lipoprotein with conserved Yx(FWY)xxD motif [Nocardioides sp. YR527]
MVAAAAFALLAAGCGSGDGSEDGGGGAALVSSAEVDGTGVLADADGHTLYTADVEKDGKIHCVDACADFWKPVVASEADVDAANSALGDEFAMVDRPDGKSQLTHDGLPLYTFAEEGAGELKGDGFTDDFQGTQFVWAAARTDGSSTPSKSSTPDDGGGGYGY